MIPDPVEKHNRLILRFFVILGAITVVLAIVVSIPEGVPESSVCIYNGSGTAVRFEEVSVDGQIVSRKPGTVIHPPSLKKYRYEMPEELRVVFRAPTASVTLTLVTIDETNQKEAVSCQLSVQRPECHFVATYRKGQLRCSGCVEEPDYMSDLD